MPTHPITIPKNTSRRRLMNAAEYTGPASGSAVKDGTDPAGRAVLESATGGSGRAVLEISWGLESAAAAAAICLARSC